MKTALFRFETSTDIGAGHAIRSGVMADRLMELGWVCKIITSRASYDFIENLKRFERISPEDFDKKPMPSDLLVIDHYGLHEDYERFCRPVSKKVMVIDDVANKKHECDFLLDQTYGRNAEDWKPLVPEYCQILAGSDYALIRKAFIHLRLSALKKRRQTKKIQRILVCMGGSDPQNITQKALQMIKDSGFDGWIDVVLGFTAPHFSTIEDFLASMPNPSAVHVHANMPQLILEADLVVGASGSGVWERCCLGVRQFLWKVADNQQEIHRLFPSTDFQSCLTEEAVSQPIIDGLGIERVMDIIEPKQDTLGEAVTHQKMQMSDLDRVYQWQQRKEIREFALTQAAPTYEEHQKWFRVKINTPEIVFEKIMCNGVPCGSLRLDYTQKENTYLLSWYIIPEFQRRGIGTVVLKWAKQWCYGRTITAFVLKGNLASHKAMEHAGFTPASFEEKGVWYVA